MTPHILFAYKGSIVPHLLPQILYTSGLSVLAVYLQKDDSLQFGAMAQQAIGYLGVLVSFLLVFKTQSSNAQWWSALTHLNQMLNHIRTVAIIASSLFKWEKDKEVEANSKRIVRLLVLYYFVVREYFQRSGSNATSNDKAKDSLRAEIRALTGGNEFSVLYPGEDISTPGSKSEHHHTIPTIILFWISLCIRKVFDCEAAEPPLLAALVGQVSGIGASFAAMDQIDKTQFPLPYAQIVKWMVLFFLSMLPFTLAEHCGWATPAFTAFATIGFFGLDEVAEILESPFGNDPNDINIKECGADLMHDLELMSRSRDFKLDCVFASDEAVDFSAQLKMADPEASMFAEQFTKDLMRHSSKVLPVNGMSAEFGNVVPMHSNHLT